MINDMLWRHNISYKDTPELMTPTTIYAKQIAKLKEEIPILGMAHITGGGLLENVSRCLPEGLKAHIDWNSWTMPEIFHKIMLAGEVPEEEMKRVFNLGIGFCIVVPPDVEIEEKVGAIDSGLAVIAQALFERLENLENLASSGTDRIPENPFASMVAQLFQQRIAGTDLYGRSDDGTFDGSTIEAEVLPSETEQP